MGEKRFQKNEWGGINLLVGPNATGKTWFVEQLVQQYKARGLKVRYLSSERLAGFSNKGIYENHSLEGGFPIGGFDSYKETAKNHGLSYSAFIVLKEKPDIKMKVEIVLSQFFGKQIKYREEAGYLKPKFIKSGMLSEYDIKQNECHGLKELIALLTFLYDDENNCLIIDEPELHLHPQFQTFFLQEIRKIAGDPLITSDKKCFFIVTHSPYFVDIRTVEDLKHCIVFQPDKLPTFISQLESEDEYRMKRLLPRLNAHHKQFFFASRPIFVEGYTDQQIFTLIQEKRGKPLGASGVCIIDAGGKNELDLFFRLCKELDIDAQFIADLDVLIEGKLSQSVSEDGRCRDYIQSEGIGQDLMKVIGDLKRKIDECPKELKLNSVDVSLSTRMQNFHEAILATRNESVPISLINLPKEVEFPKSLTDKINYDSTKKLLTFKGVMSKEEKQTLQGLSEDVSYRSTVDTLCQESYNLMLEKQRYIFLCGLKNFFELFVDLVPSNIKLLPYIKGKCQKIFEAFKRSGVHVLQKGELENYCPAYTDNPFKVPEGAKAKVFEQERDIILGSDLSEDQLRSRYGELIGILDEVTNLREIDMRKYLYNYISQFIFGVQSSYKKGEIKDTDSLMRNPDIGWQTYSRIFDLLEFFPKENGFVCKVKIKPSIYQKESPIEFDENTSPVGDVEKFL